MNDKQKKTFSKNLNKHINQTNYSQKEIADKIGVSPQALNTWVKGKAIPRMGKIQKLADFFGINKSDLIEEKLETNQKYKTVKIPVYEKVVAGSPCYTEDNIVDWAEITAEFASGGEFFGIFVEGESMEPTFLEGDLLIVRKQCSIENGELAIISIDGENATFKKVAIQKDGIVLVAYNPAIYSPHFYSNKEIEELPIKIIGKVVEFRRQL